MYKRSVLSFFLIFSLVVTISAVLSADDGVSDGELAQKALGFFSAIDEKNVAECDRGKLRDGITALRELVERIGGPVLEMRFVPISKGVFEMGDAQGEPDEKPHTVVITKDFEIGATEVTQREWHSVMGYNPSSFKGGERDRNKLGNNPNHPVETVSWNEVQEFISKLNSKNDGYLYRLPTEAEWEYAARGGTKTRYSFGDDENLLSEYGWFREGQTHKVSSLKPNPYGLYDIHGNVWEWVSDWYGDYPSAATMDPTGPSSGSARVLRGGSWYNNPQDLRSASRGGDLPVIRGKGVGCRLLRTKK